MYGLVAKLCLTPLTSWTVACQAPLSMEFSREKYWNGLPFPSSGDFPNPGIDPGSHALQADSSPTELWGKPKRCIVVAFMFMSLINFQLFFVYSMKWGSKLILLHVEVQFSQHHLLKTILPVNGLATFVKNLSELCKFTSQLSIPSHWPYIYPPCVSDCT